MTRKCFYAHSKEGRPKEEWQCFDKHISNILEMVNGIANNIVLDECSWILNKNRNGGDSL